MTTHTQDEIVARARARAKEDFFGFETGDYLEYLDFEHAKEFLNPDAEKAAWKYTVLDRGHVIGVMLNYMSFAWDKANNFRGLSASRSISHYTAWTWLAGDLDLSMWVGNADNYQHYGKEILVKICEHYGWDAKQWDDGVRKNSEDE